MHLTSKRRPTGNPKPKPPTLAQKEERNLARRIKAAEKQSEEVEKKHQEKLAREKLQRAEQREEDLAYGRIPDPSPEPPLSSCAASKDSEEPKVTVDTDEEFHTEDELDVEEEDIMEPRLDTMDHRSAGGIPIVSELVPNVGGAELTSRGESAAGQPAPTRGGMVPGESAAGQPAPTLGVMVQGESAASQPAPTLTVSTRDDRASRPTLQLDVVLDAGVVEAQARLEFESDVAEQLVVAERERVERRQHARDEIERLHQEDLIRMQKHRELELQHRELELQNIRSREKSETEAEIQRRKVQHEAELERLKLVTEAELQMKLEAAKQVKDLVLKRYENERVLLTVGEETEETEMDHEIVILKARLDQQARLKDKKAQLELLRAGVVGPVQGTLSLPVVSPGKISTAPVTPSSVFSGTSKPSLSDSGTRTNEVLDPLVQAYPTGQGSTLCITESGRRYEEQDPVEGEDLTGGLAQRGRPKTPSRSDIPVEPVQGVQAPVLQVPSQQRDSSQSRGGREGGSPRGLVNPGYKPRERSPGYGSQSRDRDRSTGYGAKAREERDRSLVRMQEGNRSAGYGTQTRDRSATRPYQQHANEGMYPQKRGISPEQGYYKRTSSQDYNRGNRSPTRGPRGSEQDAPQWVGPSARVPVPVVKWYELPWTTEAKVAGIWKGKIEVIPTAPWNQDMDITTSYISRKWINSDRKPLGIHIGDNISSIEVVVRIVVATVYRLDQLQQATAGDPMRYIAAKDYPIRKMVLRVVDRPCLPRNITAGDPWVYTDSSGRHHPRWDVCIVLDEFLEAPMILQERNPIGVADPRYEIQLLLSADYSNAVKSTSGTVQGADTGRDGKTYSGGTQRMDDIKISNEVAEVHSRFQFPGVSERDREAYMLKNLVSFNGLESDYLLKRVCAGKFAMALQQAMATDIFIWGVNACEMAYKGRGDKQTYNPATACLYAWDPKENFTVAKTLRSISSSMMTALNGRKRGEDMPPMLREEAAVQAVKILMATCNGDQQTYVLNEVQLARVDINHPLAWNVLVGCLIFTFCNPADMATRRNELSTKFIQKQDETNQAHLQRLYNGAVNCDADSMRFESAFLETTANKLAWIDVNTRRIERRSRGESDAAIDLHQAYQSIMSLLQTKGCTMQKATLTERGHDWIRSETPLSGNKSVPVKSVNVKVQESDSGRGSSNNNRGGYSYTGGNTRNNSLSDQDGKSNGKSFRRGGKRSSQSSSEPGTPQPGKFVRGPHKGELAWGISLTEPQAEGRCNVFKAPHVGDRVCGSTWREGDSVCDWCKYKGHFAACCPEWHNSHPNQTFSQWINAEQSKEKAARDACKSRT